MTKTVQTAVVGVTGYAGAELARLLLHHPRLKSKPPVFAGRVDEKDAARGGISLEEIHPQLADNNGSGSLKIGAIFMGAARGTRRAVAVPGNPSRPIARLGARGAETWTARDRPERRVAVEGRQESCGLRIRRRRFEERRGHAGEGRLRDAGTASQRDRRARSWWRILGAMPLR